MSGGSSGGKNLTQSTKVELPSWYEPTAQGAIGAATQLAQTPQAQYGGSRIAPFSPEQEIALQGTTDRALAGSPSIAPAERMATDTLQGKYLDPTTNPIWAPMTQRLSDAYRMGTAAQTDSSFSRANAFGDNSAYQQTVGQNQRAYGDTLAGLAGDLYGRERGYQMQAAGMAPALSEAGYGDCRALAGVGDVRRQYTQDVANMDYEDFLNAQNYGWNQLNRLGGTANTFLGNSGQTTQTGPNPYQSSPFASAIGTGMLGYGAGSMLAGMGGSALGNGAGSFAGGAAGGATLTPYAPYIGAAIGALGGYFGSR